MTIPVPFNVFILIRCCKNQQQDDILYLVIRRHSLCPSALVHCYLVPGIPRRGNWLASNQCKRSFFFLSSSKSLSFSQLCRKWPETWVHSPYGDWVSDVALDQSLPFIYCRLECFACLCHGQFLKVGETHKPQDLPGCDWPTLLMSG